MQDAGCRKQGANGTVAAGVRTVNFAGIAKFSQGLRKFRNHSENFAILAKFSLCEFFARLAKFRLLAKFTVDSEISHFRYLL